MSDLSSNASNTKTKGGIEINVSAPERSSYGEHSVVYGKLAIAASLGLRTKVHLVEVDCRDINQLLLDKPLPLTSNTSDFNWELPKLVDHHSHLENVDAAVSSLLNAKSNYQNISVKKSVNCLFYLLSGILSSANVKISPLCITIDSQLDLGAGAGSSASFSVALAATFAHYFKMKSLELKNVSRQGFKHCSWDRYDDDRHFGERQLEAISEWAFFAENLFHGTPSGLDNTICTYGNMVKFRKHQPPKLIKLSMSFNILLINTKVARETSKLVGQVATLKERFPRLVDHILDAMEELTVVAGNTIKKIDTASATKNETDLENGFKDLESLVQINHNLLSALGVSHQKLEEINGILEKHGLKGKLTGAGGGGFAISILPPSYDPEEVIRKLKEHDFGVICTKLGGDGVRVD